MTWRKVLLGFLFSAICISALQAKDQPVQVIIWPTSDSPVLRLTFGKFRELSSAGSRRTYAVDTTAENPWNKKISQASFSLYLFDKTKTRIAEGWVSINDLGPGESSRFQTTFGASDTPVSIGLCGRVFRQSWVRRLRRGRSPLRSTQFPKMWCLKWTALRWEPGQRQCTWAWVSTCLSSAREGSIPATFPWE